MRTITTTELINQRVVKITKTLANGSDTSMCYIINGGTYAAVAQPTANSWHVSYMQPFSTGQGKDCWNKWIHLTGKLTLKEFDSKYFSCPIFTEHFRNGNHGLTNQQKMLVIRDLEKLRQEIGL